MQEAMRHIFLQSRKNSSEGARPSTPSPCLTASSSSTPLAVEAELPIVAPAPMPTLVQPTLRDVAKWRKDRPRALPRPVTPPSAFPPHTKSLLAPNANLVSPVLHLHPQGPNLSPHGP